MKSYNSVCLLADPKRNSCLCSLFVTMSLICGAYFVGSAWLGKDSYRLSPGLVLNTTEQYSASVKCENNPKHRTSLLAVAVGIKQKRLANEIVKKFLRDDFVVMLFHYDGVVDEWHDFEWSDRVIHVSATNQTKWWFAKRFLHPDIVAEYEYVFLWDEDLGVENFHPQSWVEMMAPVFSRAAWRCVWYMIQTTAELSSQSSSSRNLSDSGPSASSELHNPNSRYNIRTRSFAEMRAFRSRWNKAVKEDECWVDPFEQPAAPQNTR
ncbi:UNVERIFIED_CONTAM: hypothetical protein Sradi_2859100 [Sesamum radiatum]|uniref:Storage protein n=1 Tax=Sesamum radiatum TaxID=300843 RepID=A0AAW2RZ46_SESRA